jgi:voltage-gated potassium channel
MSAFSNVPMRKRLYEILEHTRADDLTSRRVNIILMLGILVSVVVATLDTIPSVAAEYGGILSRIEYICVAIFCVEYVLRIWTSTVHERYAHPVLGRLLYMLRPLMLIDLLSILPAFLPILTADLLVLRSIRLLRLMRILKLGRYSKGFVLVADVLHGKRDELLAATSMLLFLLFFSSSVMFFVEREAQPQTFKSIMDALWWGVSTITSVGYGDILPVTPAGKVLGGIVQILGVGLFAIPAGVFAAGFTEEINRKKSPPRDVCPHCGKRI